MGTRATKTNSQRGFSLIELMLALSLGTMMMGITASLFIVPEATAQRQALRNLRLVSRHLFNVAIGERRQFWLVIDVDKNTWRVEYPHIDEGAGTVENKIYEFDGNPEIEENNDFPESMSILDIETVDGNETIGEVALTYRQSGFVDPYVIHFELKNDETEVKSFQVQPLSGFVDILDGNFGLSGIE